MSSELILLLTVALLLAYASAVLALALLGRGSEARALAGFIPDCIVLFRRLLGDKRVPHSRKLLLLALLAYLALPFDLIPDFIPVAGQLDDAIVAGLVCASFSAVAAPPCSTSIGRARRPAPA